MKLKKPDIIIFDIDDTLYDTKEPHLKALNSAFEFLNKITNIRIESIKEIYSNSREEIKMILGSTAASHSRLLYFQRLLETVKCIDVMQNSLDCEDIYWSTYLENMKVADNKRKLGNKTAERVYNFLFN